MSYKDILQLVSNCSFKFWRRENGRENDYDNTSESESEGRRKGPDASVLAARAGL